MADLPPIPAAWKWRFRTAFVIGGDVNITIAGGTLLCGPNVTME